jgi:hypothetical protein
MSIMYQWTDSERVVLLATFDGTWTWADFHTKVREMHAEIAALKHPVQMVLWHRVEYPLGNPLIHFNEAAKMQPANVSRVVVVVPGEKNVVRSFLMSLSSVVRKLYPTKSAVTIVQTLEEAERLLGRPLVVQQA